MIGTIPIFVKRKGDGRNVLGRDQRRTMDYRHVWSDIHQMTEQMFYCLNPKCGWVGNDALYQMRAPFARKCPTCKSVCGTEPFAAPAKPKITKADILRGIHLILQNQNAIMEMLPLIGTTQPPGKWFSVLDELEKRRETTKFAINHLAEKLK